MYDYILFASSIGPTSTLTRQNSFTVIQRWITIKALHPLFVLCRVLRVTNAFYFLRFTGSVLTPPFELDAVRDAAWRLGRSQTSTRGARDIPDSGKPDSFFFSLKGTFMVFLLNTDVCCAARRPRGWGWSRWASLVLTVLFTLSPPSLWDPRTNVTPKLLY